MLGFITFPREQNIVCWLPNASLAPYKAYETAATNKYIAVAKLHHAACDHDMQVV